MDAMEDGKLLVLRKITEPILAYSDKGFFDVNDLENMPFGLHNWIENASTLIGESFNLTEDSVAKYRALWHQYETKQPLSRSDLPHYNPSDILQYISKEESDKLIRLVDDSISSWQRNGYTVHICDREFMDDHRDIYEWALGSMFAPYTDAIYSLTFKIDKEWTNAFANQFIKTTWVQEDGYNQSFPYRSFMDPIPVGCGNLAMGQLMKYYEYPHTYDWSQMPLRDVL